MSDQASLATTPSETGPTLALRPEPKGVREELRRLVGDDPIVGRAEALRRLSSLLWRVWRSELAPLGMTAASFRIALEGADQEIWLWVMGDRPFNQLQQSLAGRALRRLQREERSE